MPMKILVAIVAIVTLAACGNGNSNGDGGSDGSNGPPVCGAVEFIAAGTLNGSPVEERATVSGQFLVNVPGDTGCHVNVYFQGGGRLRGRSTGRPRAESTWGIAPTGDMPRK
jgi:hypothetical protein